MKRYTTFSKALELEPHHQIFSVISRALVEAFLLLSKGAVGVFNNTS